MRFNPFRRSAVIHRPPKTSVSREEVVWAYETFLGRQPESDAALEECRQAHSDIKEIVASFLNSDEYRSRRYATEIADVEWCHELFLGRKPESNAISKLYAAAQPDLRQLVAFISGTQESRNRYSSLPLRASSISSAMYSDGVDERSEDNLRSAWPEVVVDAIWGPAGIRDDALCPLPAAKCSFPEGWASHTELVLLYNLALHSPGPILEIGPWIGRSTTALCLGLRDRDSVRVPFDTIDFGHTGVDEFTRAFGALPPNENDALRVTKTVETLGGSIAVLIAGLRDNGLLDCVTQIMRGDFLQMPLARTYSLVFCDTVHDEHEARRNLPRISEYLNPGAIIVFDDVMEESFADVICCYLPACRRLLLQQHDKYSKYLLVKLSE